MTQRMGRLDESLMGRSSEGAAPARRSGACAAVKCTPKSALQKLHQYVPITKWLPEFRHHLGTLKGDLIAGLTVGVMVVPQAMSYASVAGLKPVFGLYTAFIALIPYVFFGTSSHLITGPTAVMSLIVHNVVPKVWAGVDVPEESEQWQHLAFAMAFFAGIVQVTMGLLNLGFVMNFISEPVIVGFTSAAALIIASTQISHLIGIKKCKGPGRACFFYESVEATIRDVSDKKYDVPTVVMAVVLLAFLISAKYLLKPLLKKVGMVIQARIKAKKGKRTACDGALFSIAPLISLVADFAPLAAVVGSIIFTHAMSDDNGGTGKHPSYAFAHCKTQHAPVNFTAAWPTGSMVCNILPGLPKPGLPFPTGATPQGITSCPPEKNGVIPPCILDTVTWAGSFKDYVGLISPCISIVLIGYMESMTIASTCFRKYRGFQIRPSQELVALGSCNFITSFFQGYSVTGSFSRTAVNADTGASSPVSGALAACIVGIVLLTLTQVMYFMPKVTLSAIVITAVIKLIDIAEAIKFWVVKKSDFAIFALVFITTLVAGIDAGLIVGICANWLVVLLHLDPMTPLISTPKCVVNIIGRVDGVANRWVDMHTNDAVMRNSSGSSSLGAQDGPETTTWEIAFINHWPLMMFVNSGYLSRVTTELSSRYTLRYIVMNWKHVEMTDSSGLQTLQQRLDDMRNLVDGAQICIVDPNEQVRALLLVANGYAPSPTLPLFSSHSSPGALDLVRVRQGAPPQRPCDCGGGLEELVVPQPEAPLGRRKRDAREPPRGHRRAGRAQPLHLGWGAPRAERERGGGRAPTEAAVTHRLQLAGGGVPLRLARGADPPQRRRRRDPADRESRGASDDIRARTDGRRLPLPRRHAGGARHQLAHAHVESAASHPIDGDHGVGGAVRES